MVRSCQKEYPRRKHPAHMVPVERQNRNILLFVTCAIHPRGHFLATPDFHAVFLDACRRADAWRTGRYVIMPDHVHFFCTPARFPAVALRAWLRFLKERITKQLGATHQSAGKPWRWQADAWDTQIRDGEHYHEKWLYVLNNPVRAGLVGKPDQWPFQGEVNTLEL
ncbi:MAG TPA: hypothetical protein PLU38_09705 [Kiritimatiellia bacterium]|nr:MAG: hypothetical protein BWX70_01533 [Verrucomicrobia bacterium ADurb.Bin070]HPB10942.1 hypothetical protein [Kiritimatiellia bacterium]HPO39043.1 hypothetical protein [Kiritimatiellia bacterium]HQA38344.1 hypothetical protein [Kiritimatiellia bacterium]HQQ92127.1 hypothetical protein [Kiritimatiellia bacterium]